MEIDVARRKLEALRNTLTGRVGRLDEHIRRDGQALDQDSAEAVTEMENDAVLDSLDDQGRAELGQIDHALARLDSGQYHVCSKCGATISDDRLNALPYTTVCVQCA